MIVPGKRYSRIGSIYNWEYEVIKIENGIVYLKLAKAPKGFEHLMATDYDLEMEVAKFIKSYKLVYEIEGFEV